MCPVVFPPPGSHEVTSPALFPTVGRNRAVLCPVVFPPPRSPEVTSPSLFPTVGRNRAALYPVVFPPPGYYVKLAKQVDIISLIGSQVYSSHIPAPGPQTSSVAPNPTSFYNHPMKISVSQLNPIVGDFPGNTNLILVDYHKAVANDCDFAVFPASAFCGEPLYDLAQKSTFANGLFTAFSSMTRVMNRPIALIGLNAQFGRLNQKSPSKAVAVVQNGRIIGFYYKDVGFIAGENPGALKDLVGERTLELNLESTSNGTQKTRNVTIGIILDDEVPQFSQKEPDLIFHLSATPFQIQRNLNADQSDSFLVCNSFQHYPKLFDQLPKNVPVINCNLVGGNDGLVFHGGSSAFIKLGQEIKTIHQGKFFSPDYFVVDIDDFENNSCHVSENDELSNHPSRPTSKAINFHVNQLVNALALGLCDYCRKSGFTKVLVGISGGIDSAVVCALAAYALGPDAVIGLSMPSTVNSPETVKDAALLAKNLKITFYEIPINDILMAQVDALTPGFAAQPSGITRENLQARIRAALLMAWSNHTGAMVLDTSNKTELAVGYSTLYGDLIGGLSVIGDLTKDRVYAVAHELNRLGFEIPPQTLTRAPSAELREGQLDVDSLPPYPILDRIVQMIIEEDQQSKAVIDAGLPPKDVAWFLKVLQQNEFKRRQAPPVLKVTSKAFGHDMTIPVINRFKEDPQ